jgi:hypothetical protein
VRFGQWVIAETVADVLAHHVDPGGDLDPRGRGIPDALGLYAWGWWPLVALDRWVHRHRWDVARRCAARGCDTPVPPGRRTYCSERCRQREKKRRQRGSARMPSGTPGATRTRARSPAKG